MALRRCAHHTGGDERYGHAGDGRLRLPLAKQHGAHLRLIAPWEYGFKSVKSIVEIEFTKERSKTFWEFAGPSEYGFWVNVNLKFDHPRWSKATEKMLGTKEVRPTQIFNGYGK